MRSAYDPRSAQNISWQRCPCTPTPDTEDDPMDVEPYSMQDTRWRSKGQQGSSAGPGQAIWHLEYWHHQPQQFIFTAQRAAPEAFASLPFIVVLAQFQSVMNYKRKGGKEGGGRHINHLRVCYQNNPTYNILLGISKNEMGEAHFQLSTQNSSQLWEFYCPIPHINVLAKSNLDLMERNGCSTSIAPVWKNLEYGNEGGICIFKRANKQTGDISHLQIPWTKSREGVNCIYIYGVRAAVPFAHRFVYSESDALGGEADNERGETIEWKRQRKRIHFST